MSYDIKIALIVALFTIIEIIIISKYTKHKNKSRIVINISIYGLFIAFLITQNLFGFYVESIIIFICTITVLGHILGGEYLKLYETSIAYDRLLHLFGTFSFTLLIYSVIIETTQPVSGPQIYNTLFVIALGISIGTFFELLEFLLDVASKNSKSHQKGLQDTNVDMIANVIGAVIASLTYMYFI